MGGLFKQFAKSVLNDLASYRTLKVVKISDKRLAYTHKLLMIAIVAYSVLTLIGLHSYMLKEKPDIHMDVTFDDQNVETAVANSANSAYCGASGAANAAYDFSGDATYGYAAYTSNQCVAGLRLADVTYSDADSAKVYTHYSSTTWTSTNDCATSVACDKTIPSATRNGINAFTLTSELYTMSIKATFMTSWGETGVPVKVFVLDSTGKLDNTFSTSSTNLYTQYPNYTVAAFAALSGYTLDTENSLTVSDTFTGNLPVYRLTGMELSVNVDFSNFRAINEYDPFNFDDHATMTVRLINGGDFVSPEYKNVDFNAVTLEAATAGATYEFRGVYLDFQSSGLMGVFDWYTMIVAIIACFVLIGIATSVMDVLGAFVYDSFKNDKYEDDGERQHIEHMILNMETNGVPFRHDDFQVMPNVSIRDFLKVLQRDIVKLSTLAHHMSRDLSAAGLNRHTMEIAQIDASAVKAARFVCVLIGPDRSELFLTGGPQTLGRGHGGMHSKKISHKQLSVIANTHTGAALVRGLPTKNCSGVALGGGPWQTLTENDEVEIMNGDMIGLVLEEAADEDETMVEGVFMFKAYPQEDKKSEGGGWFGGGGNRA